jgi:hypothetical protein
MLQNIHVSTADRGLLNLPRLEIYLFNLALFHTNMIEFCMPR